MFLFREKCKKLTILISKLDIDKLMEKSEVNNRTMDELRNESTKQHDLIMKINKIQKVSLNSCFKKEGRQTLRLSSFSRQSIRCRS